MGPWRNAGLALVLRIENDDSTFHIGAVTLGKLARKPTLVTEVDTNSYVPKEYIAGPFLSERIFHVEADRTRRGGKTRGF